MKRVQTSIAILIALVFAGISTVKSVDSGQLVGKATVRTVHGTVEYSRDGQTWEKVRVNMEFEPGVKIKTAPDSSCDLNVNGSASVVRVEPDSIMSIPTMNRTGRHYDADTDTMLKIDTGTIEGNVKKLSASSQYEIETPHGVAGIRGTDFRVQVRLAPNGTVIVTFFSITGQVFVSAEVNNQMVVKQLHTGEQWTPGGSGAPGSEDVQPIPPAVLTAIMQVLIQITNPQNVQPQPTPIVHPFQTGTPTQGGSSSTTAPSNQPVSDSGS